MKNFIKVCKKSQKDLKAYLKRWLKSNGYKPIVEDGYIYAEGSEPVCVTAHMDTVHPTLPKAIIIEKHEGKTIISSPQGIGGDDRCGVYMIQRLVEQGFKPTIVFCEDEEIGGVGSNKLLKNLELMDELAKVKFFIELDRAHANDLVYYDDENEEFHEWCSKVTGYKLDWGSFSDISHLCPDAKVSGVNISCGYYKAHTLQEYVVWEEMEASIEAAAKMLTEARKDEVKQFEYKEDIYGRWDDFDKMPFNRKIKWYNDEYVIFFYNEDGKEDLNLYEANTADEAIGKWAQEHPTIPFSYVMGVEEDYDGYYSDYFYDRKAAK